MEWFWWSLGIAVGWIAYRQFKVWNFDRKAIAAGMMSPRSIFDTKESRKMDRELVKRTMSWNKNLGKLLK
jgi:hypothetical protein